MIECPDEWQPYISNCPMNAIVFMNQWMNHSADRESFNTLSDRYADRIHVTSFAGMCELQTILHADVFRFFDEIIIAYLQDQLVNDVKQFAVYKDILFERRRLHWYPEFQHEYEAIEHARWLLQFVQEKDGYLPEQSASEMFQAYSTDYYRADLFYRKFYASYDQMEQKSRLTKLREKVENVYTNWFLQELAVKWMNRLERDQSLMWAIDGIGQQHQFYHTFVQPIVKAGERVFVIISDAMRFEIAKELMDLLNNERKASTDLKTMQGVVPSYTDLGMAALLLLSIGEGRGKATGFTIKTLFYR